MDSKGILFQKIGQAYTFEGIWKVFSSGNIQNYTHEIIQMEAHQSYLKDIKKLLNNETANYDLDNLIRELRVLTDSIKDVNSIIIEERRFKRKIRKTR